MHRIEYNDYDRSISVSAWASAYAYESQTDALHFLSLGGHTNAVKAILSALVSNRCLSVEIQAEDEKLILSAPHWKRLRTFCARLPSGNSHGILLAGGGDDDTSILVLDATPERIFKVLYETFPLTALPEWSEWLVARLEEEGHLCFLESHNLKAAIVNVNEEQLDKIVAEGVTGRTIKF